MMFETLLAMDPATLLTFMGAAFVLYLTPGADLMFTLASGMAGGPRAGVSASAGISFGVFVHCCMAAAGLAALVAAAPIALDVIRWGGVAYLLWLAYSMWTVPAQLEPQDGRSGAWRAARRGFVTNLLNPKVGLFVLAFLPQFTDPSIGPVWQQILILGALQASGGFLVSALIGTFAGIMAERMRRFATLINKCAAMIFGGLALRLAWD
jgi:threonine/homoserine/homoserine lactone efflux protein